MRTGSSETAAIFALFTGFLKEVTNAEWSRVILQLLRPFSIILELAYAIAWLVIHISGTCYLETTIKLFNSFLGISWIHVPRYCLQI